MTVFSDIKSKKIDEFVDWLYEHFRHTEAPWYEWYEENYCSECEPVERIESTNDFGYKIECAYCELNGNCRFFKEMEEVPDIKQIIKLWLKSKSN